MRDKRPVDELSIEELERILAIRKREARRARLQRYESSGRRIATPDMEDDDDDSPAAESAAPKETDLPVVEVADDAKIYYEGEPQFEDELETRRKPKQGGRKSLRVMLWNRALLLVEIAAALGLIALFVSMFQALQDVSRVSAEIQAQAQATTNAGIVPPTPTPIITVVDVVLPSGHTYQGDLSAFNLDEVPAQYRDQFRAMLLQPQALPTSSPEGPVHIKIDAIAVDAAVYTGDDWETLKLGAGHRIGSGNPGQRGNMVISAHDDIYGEIFRKLDQLRPGDTIIVSTVSKDYTYVVQPQPIDGKTLGYQLVAPTDVWVLKSQGDTKLLTLISCYPYRVDTKRIVVFAKLQE